MYMILELRDEIFHEDKGKSRNLCDKEEVSSNLLFPLIVNIYNECMIIFSWYFIK